MNNATIYRREILIVLEYLLKETCKEKPKVSHVIEDIRVDDNYKDGTIRISFGKNNNICYAEELALAIVEILKSMQ